VKLKNKAGWVELKRDGDNYLLINNSFTDEGDDPNDGIDLVIQEWCKKVENKDLNGDYFQCFNYSTYVWYKDLSLVLWRKNGEFSFSSKLTAKEKETLIKEFLNEVTLSSACPYDI